MVLFLCSCGLRDLVIDLDWFTNTDVRFLYKTFILFVCVCARACHTPEGGVGFLGAGDICDPLRVGAGL